MFGHGSLGFLHLKKKSRCKKKKTITCGFFYLLFIQKAHLTIPLGPDVYISLNTCTCVTPKAFNYIILLTSLLLLTKINSALFYYY